MAGAVEIQVVPETRVAYMRYVGPYGVTGIAHLWQRFQFWCEKEGLTSPPRRMFGIAQDNPNITPPDRTRYDACIQVDAAFQPREGIGVQTIAGGRYGCTPFKGTTAEIRAAWIRFLTRTLPGAGLQPDLAPAIEIYAPDFVVDARTGVFSCLLGMPLRSP
jgi:AraC family transcriptional regulator